MIVRKGYRKGFVVVKCEDCGKEREVRRNTDILAKKEHPCRTCSNKRNGKKKVGRPSWNNGKHFEPKKIGSTYIDYHGYVEVWCGIGTGVGRKDGYALQHRLMMEESLGRKLSKEEIVHHLDGNKLNNNISNLLLCRNMSDHREIHNSLESAAFELYKLGYIVFDGKVRKYLPKAK